MKRIIYVFCVAVSALFVMVSCSKSDSGEDQVKKSNFNIPVEAKAIIPEELIGKMAANGMTINEGTNPPNIEGIFATGMFKLTYKSSEEDNYPIGKEIEGYRYKFYEQKGTKVKADYVHEDLVSDDNATGKGAIISGSGNKFTAYLKLTGSFQGVTYTQGAVYSGEITANGVKDFQWAFCLLDKKNDHTNKLMPIGGIRIWVDKSKLAVKKQEYPYGD